MSSARRRDVVVCCGTALLRLAAAADVAAPSVRGVVPEDTKHLGLGAGDQTGLVLAVGLTQRLEPSWST